MWLSHKVSQIYKQYPCSIFSLFVFYMKPGIISIIISGITDPLYRPINFIDTISITNQYSHLSYNIQ